jgi:hypothetical protein
MSALLSEKDATGKAKQVFDEIHDAFPAFENTPID